MICHTLHPYFNPIIVLFLTKNGAVNSNTYNTFQSYYSLISNKYTNNLIISDDIISILL